MDADAITKLTAKREALDHQIASHKPLARIAAVNKVRAFVTKLGMTEDDLFPLRYDLTAAPVPEPIRDFPQTPFSNFHYEDTFGYTPIADLKEKRFQLDEELRAIQREAIERARNFIFEYKLTKEDIFANP